MRRFDRRRAFFVAGGMLAPIAVGACGTHDCDMKGYVSGVSITIPNRSWELAEFCVDTQCLSSVELAGDQSFLVVQDRPAEYSYRVRVVTPDGAEVTHEGVVRTTSFRGNGPGCGPVTANAVLNVEANGEITVSSP